MHTLMHRTKTLYKLIFPRIGVAAAITFFIYDYLMEY